MIPFFTRQFDDVNDKTNSKYKHLSGFKNIEFKKKIDGEKVYFDNLTFFTRQFDEVNDKMNSEYKHLSGFKRCEIQEIDGETVYFDNVVLSISTIKKYVHDLSYKCSWDTIFLTTGKNNTYTLCLKSFTYYAKQC